MSWVRMIRAGWANWPPGYPLEKGLGTFLLYGVAHLVGGVWSDRVFWRRLFLGDIAENQLRLFYCLYLFYLIYPK